MMHFSYPSADDSSCRIEAGGKNASRVVPGYYFRKVRRTRQTRDRTNPSHLDRGADKQTLPALITEPF